MKKIICLIAVTAITICLASCTQKSEPSLPMPTVITTTKRQITPGTNTQNEAEEDTYGESYYESDGQPETVTVTVVVTAPSEKQYGHSAVQGAVIVSQDGTTHCRYKQKCEICGYVSSSTNSCGGTSGSSTSGFCCPKCQKHQKVEIAHYS